MTKRTAEFKLVPTTEFDARRGYSRWVTPGVGIRTTERGSLAQADIWVDRQGKLVTRFTSLGYSLHFKIKAVPPGQITFDSKEDVVMFLQDVLLTWTAEGVDDDLDCYAVEYDDLEC
jgi:hypothetical protein